MRSIFRRVLLAVAVIILLFLLVALYLSSSTHGLQQLLGLVQRSLPGEFQVAQVEGRLLDTITLRQVHYQNDALNISVKQLRLDWNPWALVHGKAHIYSIDIQEPEVHIFPVKAPSQNDTPAFTLSLPEITWPLSLHLDRLLLSQLAFSPANEIETTSQPVQVNRLLLQSHTQGERIIVDRFELDLPELKAELSGTLIPKERYPFHLVGAWQDLRYPAGAVTPLLQGEGSFSLHGTVDNYSLDLQSALKGKDLPAGEWSALAEGNYQGFTALELSGKTLDGVLKGGGEVSWLPVLSWKLDVTGEQLNPGIQWAEWSGLVDFQLKNRGSKAVAQPLEVEIEHVLLNGTLRGEPIKGQAVGLLKGTDISIQTLSLNVASATLNASGTVGEQVDLNMAVKMPALERVLPHVKGAFIGKGSLKGPKDSLQLVAEINANSLSYEDNKVERLTANLDINLMAGQPSQLDLQAQQLTIAGEQWTSLNVEGVGRVEKHQVSLRLSQGPAEVDVELEGAWDKALWQGKLLRADLQNDLLGSWGLQQPVDTEISREAASIAHFCWRRIPTGSGALCGQGRWTAEKGSQGRFDIQQLSLGLLAPFIPPAIEVEGKLESQITFRQALGEQPEFSVAGRIPNSVVLLPGSDLKVISGESAFNINGENGQLNADFSLPVVEPAGRLQGRIFVKDFYDDGQISGVMEAELSDLGFVSLFLPQLQGVKGGLDAKVSLRGRMTEPVMLGYLTLKQGEAELPALGLKLGDIELDVRDQAGNSALLVNGSMRSGDGVLQLSGQLDPINGSGQIQIKGERLQAVATEELKVWISPQIAVDVTPTLIKLRGEVNVPKAHIFPPKTTASYPLSSDVVILEESDQSGQEVPKRHLDTQIRLTLGDQVEVDALGFKGRLQGSVLIEEDGRRATRATGSLAVASGQYRLYGQDLNIERGSLVFSGGPVDNPGLDLRVSRKVDEVIAGARVGGTLSEPRLALFSEPSMPESGILSYLVFGRPPGAGNNSASEQELLFRAASALTMKGGNVVAEKLSDLLDLNEVGLEGDSLNSTAFYIGKYLSPKLYVKYGVGVLEPGSTFLMRYQLSKRWSVESQTGTNNSGGDLIYTLEH
ncbi:translocation/assembly module TamB domain-containing protein [Neptunomonas concharum]|uniref:Translocation and assembly module TamB C-terminal domain-containing protein n=1 Tax=Neptunomonas concharum TaxID=1031538 RepID=A0A5P1RDL8_9GAMM|nr:translocation/assembly module TamB domain-containing protein [Neptunomonas concharum]QEQ97744.1 hypothetical protein F0U83_13995 [Neptunomonas concharum]